MASFTVGSIQPNPFRRIDRYPIRRDKVQALRESLRTTGFWDNVVARVREGKPEIAYGHHRLVALKEEYGLRHKVELIVRDLADEQMLQIMARENMEEWGTSAVVEHETVRAVVEAYGHGKIALPKPHKSTNKDDLRFAPGFASSTSAPVTMYPYNADTVATFLGRLDAEGHAQRKIRDALGALQFIEEGILKECDFEGLTTMQAHAVVEQARKSKAAREASARVHEQDAERARSQAEAATSPAERRIAQRSYDASAKRAAEDRREARRVATAVGRAVSKSIKTGDKGFREAPKVALDAEVAAGRPKPEAPPDIDSFAADLAKELILLLDPERDKRRVQKLVGLIQWRHEMNARIRIDLVKTLRQVSARMANYADRLEGPTDPTKHEPLALPTNSRKEK